MVQITKGKFDGLQRLSNDKGIIAALAIDQRGSLKKMIQEAKGSESDKDVEDFKKLVSEELTPYASAILLDLQYGTPAIKARNENCGLLTSYEKTGYDATTPGKLPDLIADLSALRIKENGGDAVKILVYYDPDEPAEINEIKYAFLERISAECREVDIPFFLEPITYDAKVTDSASAEYAKLKPAKVKASIKEFSKPRYGVDVLKLEVPVNFKYVEGFAEGETVYTKEEAGRHFEECSDLSPLPFIYLSAGVTAELFHKTIAFANEHKVQYSGVLCGRATWKDGIEVYGKQGDDALREWLRTQGKENITSLDELLNAGASPWWSKYGSFEDVHVVEKQ
ncbi:tagatose-bisphosphate aldolase [Listeria booriae]|uniref:tagatose-bisphosphate aldolase n=1 Tax=Listeria booriae TaxID=1552123 RepID=UPI00164D589E|nr:tagatose-bisphosphate aldolase [Listeria booriae]MBC6164940.1 tagatose-bisphosphate aldolase [Listeria booriae]